MGTYGIYEPYSDEALARECFQPWTDAAGNEHTYTDIRKTNYGRNVWYVGRMNGEPEYIGLNLIKRANKHEWAYKPLDESMGPAEEDCPLALLNLVPAHDNEYAREWRDRVRAYHAEQSAKRKAQKALVTGAKIRLMKNIRPERYSEAEGTIIDSKKGKLIVNIDGLRVAVPKRLVAGVVA